MKRPSRLYLSLVLLFTCYIFQAQESQKIRFSKRSDLIYFFQIGIKSDSIIKGKTDRFYFVLNDSLKGNTIIDVENGRLIKTENDSILKLEFLPGMRYETLYLKNTDTAYHEKKTNAHFELNTRVNGASEFDRKKIRIRVMDKRRNEVLMENVFVYGK